VAPGICKAKNGASEDVPFREHDPDRPIYGVAGAGLPLDGAAGAVVGDGGVGLTG
jgi:hypothetical protein